MTAVAAVAAEWTPERIAVERDRVSERWDFTESGRYECLDLGDGLAHALDAIEALLADRDQREAEIERLRTVVAASHSMIFSSDGEVWCSGCFWNHDSMPCDAHCASGASATCDDCCWWPMLMEGDADAEFAAHVAVILGGGS